MNEYAVTASFLLSKLIAQKCKPIFEKVFIKECLITIVETVCPQRKNLFSDTSLSARTVTRRIEDMSQNLYNELNQISQTFTAYSLALDESLDCTLISQLSVFIRGTNEIFEIHEKLLKVVLIHNTTKGIDIFMSYLYILYCWLSYNVTKINFGDAIPLENICLIEVKVKLILFYEIL
jgi:hypothetical protein